jgi:hypothetical protein
MIMKHLKFFLVALLAVLAFPHTSLAQTMANGKVQAVIVVGDVQLIAANGTSSPLKRGQIFEQGNKVQAGKDSNALLVMSNGATLHVKAETTLDVANFQQQPYDESADGTFLRLTKDPSKSDTDLKLSNGSLQGEVKKLDTGAGSRFTVDTPAGSAGIRGTIIDITIVRNAAGQVTGIIANCVVGSISFTPSVTTTTTTGTGSTTTVTNANINTAATITVNLTVDPNTGLIVGGNLVGANLSTTAAQDLANTLNDVTNTALVQAGLPQQPPPSIPPSGGVTVSNNTQTINVAPAAPASTGASTGSPVNSNPQNATSPSVQPT